MSRKDMRRTDWRRVTERDYVCRPIEMGGRSGVAGLLTIRALTAPLTVAYPCGPVKIADTGYAWLQIALRDTRYWLTAMFDDQERLIQMYFDITDGNHFSDPDNPWFEDMYLDICAAPDGGLYVLDEDELEEALRQGAVSAEQYARAKTDCAALLQELRAHQNAYSDFCEKLMAAMKA